MSHDTRALLRLGAIQRGSQVPFTSRKPPNASRGSPRARRDRRLRAVACACALWPLRAALHNRRIYCVLYVMRETRGVR